MLADQGPGAPNGRNLTPWFGIPELVQESSPLVPPKKQQREEAGARP